MLRKKTQTKYTNNSFPLDKYFPTIFNEKAEVTEGRLQKARCFFLPSRCMCSSTHVPRTTLIGTRRSLSPA